MGQYTPPLRDIRFVLHELLHTADTFADMPAFAEMDEPTINAIVEEAGKFSAAVVYPLNQSGDAQGCQWHDGVVTEPDGFKAAYEQYVQAGWPALTCDPEYGGQGLPVTLNNVLYECLNTANIAWTMYPGLSHGAYDCIHAHGSEFLQQAYLPNLVSGTWTGTMCLTEPHCGTDLGLLRTKAVPRGDDSYTITGTKIFISSGEHGMAENIIHLVLARLPDAPAGTKGISLFVVPKFIPNADGSLGARNPITCGAIEHKMGIHANSTCVMNLDEAQGWLVGEPHRGLQAMFVMMNAARLGVGVQGLGLTEAAYQQSRTYARERLQMRALTGAKSPDKEADAIIVHPDVRRMLLTQRAYAEGGRAFLYWLSLQIDREFNHADEDVREQCKDMVALLTPIAKAFLTDNAFECANHGVQVFGGHGFITENGVEQYVRDARITQLYEGTNGVQALDLLGRKVMGDMGAALKIFGQLIRDFVEEHGVNPSLQEFVNPLADIASKVEKLTMEVGMKALQNKDEVGAASVPYLRVVGHMVFSYFWAQMALIALSKQDEDDFYKAKLATARFYFAKLLPETAGYIRQARAGSASLFEMQEAWF